MSVRFSSKLPAHKGAPSLTLTSCTLTLIRWPDLCTVPNKSESTPCSRPAAIGSSLGSVYLRTVLVGRTTMRLTLLKLVIRASASPTPRYSSSDGWLLNRLKGNTATDLMEVTVGGGRELFRFQK